MTDKHLIQELLSTIQNQLPMKQLIEQVVRILESQLSDDAVQTPLLDLLGYEILETDIIQVLISMRQNMKQIQQTSQQLSPNKIVQQVQECNENKSQTKQVVNKNAAHIYTITQQRQKVTQLTSQLIDCSFIPENKQIQPDVQLLQISELPCYFQSVFDGYTKLNAMQSTVYETAYKQSQNLLISAPTSAGKTNVAMLCILRMIYQFLKSEPGYEEQYEQWFKQSHQQQDICIQIEDTTNSSDQLTEHSNSQSNYSGSQCGSVIKQNQTKNKFKLTTDMQVKKKQQKFEGNSILKHCKYLCIYLTPMKALASEITQKFKNSLLNLGLRVLECTGDEQPPQHLVDNANVLILTPEKYDVITRKINSDNPIYLRQQLLIIDEIHLLGVQQRGPVLETIVCRTKQAIEKYQTPIRMVGISATIPNYQDIADFLNVPSSGLFVFGDQFRPIQMSQLIVAAKDLKYTQMQDSRNIKQFEIDAEQKTVLEKYDQFKDVYECLVDVQTQLLQSFQFSDNQKGQNVNKNKKQPPKNVFKSLETDQILDELAIGMCVRNADNLHPTLLFVHSRRGTVDLAHKIALLLPNLQYCNEKAVIQAKQCESGTLSLCISKGVGFHNAEMDKRYRQLVENLFRQGELYVVVCTSTLAWGVNLPSQTVIIRGTTIFTDQGKQDLDVLDVKQILGRAGRPQFTQKGEVGRGIIITTKDKYQNYLSLLNNETLIESSAGRVLPDMLNSEIVLGNISTVQNALDYIKKTFYYIRVRNCDEQTVYALSQLQISKLLHAETMITTSSTQILTPTELGRICSHYYVDYNTLKNFTTKISKTAVGNYLQYEDLIDYLSQVPFFSQFKPRQDENQELMVISGNCYQVIDLMINQNNNKLTTKQLNKKVNDLVQNKSTACKLAVREQDSESGYKANILIQSFISRYDCKTPSLIADRKLISQQLGRISQALFEALLIFKRLDEALKMLDLINSILYQQWYDEQSPLVAFVIAPIGQVLASHGNFQVTIKAEEKICKFIQKSTVAKFHSYYEISKLHSYEQFMNIEYQDMRVSIGDINAQQIQLARKYIPQLDFDVYIVPVSQKALRIVFHGIALFKWDKYVHGYQQVFLVAIARADNGLIVHHEKVIINEESLKKSIDITVLIKVSKWKKAKIGQQQVPQTNTLQQIEIEDDISNDDNEVPLLKVVVTPIIWTGGSQVRQERIIQLRNIVIQESNNIQYKSLSQQNICFQNQQQTFYTPLPKLKPLSIKALHFQEAESLFKFQYFNPLQTAMFHALYYSRKNVFIGAPTSCGKTVAAEIALLQQLKNLPGLKTVYIAPIKALVRERYQDWQQRYKQLNIQVLELTSESLIKAKQLQESLIYIATPEKFDAITRQLQEKQFLQTIGLIIFDEVHLIGNSRGYVLEAIVARFKMYSKQTRLIGMSIASPSVGDLARWLCVPQQNIFNFDSNARPVRLDVHIQGFIGEAYCPRMELMNKPVYSAIKKFAPTLPVLVFVSSRRQTRLTAMSLIQQSQTDPGSPECFWKIPNDALAQQIIDPEAADALRYGVGVHHAAMNQTDKDTIQQLFNNGQITVLVCTATMAWGVNVPAYMTILKGCEFYDKNQDKYIDFDISDINQMCGRAGRPQFIQNRYKQWIKQYFGDQQLQVMEQMNAFSGMYNFESEKIIKFFKNQNQTVYDTLQQLQDKDQSTPKAVSLIMCRSPMKQLYKDFIQEPLPFESSLLNKTLGNALAAALLKTTDNSVSSFPDVINAEITAKESISLIQLRNWLQLTYFFIRARCNPQLYGIDSYHILEDLEGYTLADLEQFQEEFSLYSNNKQISKQNKSVLVDFLIVMEIYHILNKQIEILIEKQLVQCMNQSEYYIQHKYKATYVGLLTSKYYLSYLTLPYFLTVFYGQVDKQQENMQILNMLQALSSCPEFRQLAVRNQENIDIQQLTNKYQFEVYPGVTTLDQYNNVEAKSYFLFQFQTRQLQNDNLQNKTMIKLPNPDYQLDLNSLLENAIRIVAATVEVGLQTNQNIIIVKQAIIVSQQLIQGANSFDDVNFFTTNKQQFKFKQILRHFFKTHTINQIKINNDYREFLQQFPNLQYQIYIKLQEFDEKKQGIMLIDVEVQFAHVNNSANSISKYFKGKYYQKQKQHTYYCILHDEDNQQIMGYQKQSNTSLNNLIKFENINFTKNLKVIVESDCFINLGLDTTIKIQNITTQWQKVYDSFDEQYNSNQNDVVITIE